MSALSAEEIIDRDRQEWKRRATLAETALDAERARHAAEVAEAFWRGVTAERAVWSEDLARALHHDANLHAECERHDEAMVLSESGDILADGVTRMRAAIARAEKAEERGDEWKRLWEKMARKATESAEREQQRIDERDAAIAKLALAERVVEAADRMRNAVRSRSSALSRDGGWAPILAEEERALAALDRAIDAAHAGKETGR